MSEFFSPAKASDYDPKYEFNAPKFCDFANLDLEADDNADIWFDEPASSEKSNALEGSDGQKPDASSTQSTPVIYKHISEQDKENSGNYSNMPQTPAKVEYTDVMVTPLKHEVEQPSPRREESVQKPVEETEVEVEISATEIEQSVEVESVEPIVESVKPVKEEPVVEAEEIIESAESIKAETVVQPIETDPVVKAEETMEAKPIVESRESVEGEHVVESEEPVEVETVVEAEMLVVAEPEEPTKSDELVQTKAEDLEELVEVEPEEPVEMATEQLIAKSEEVIEAAKPEEVVETAELEEVVETAEPEQAVEIAEPEQAVEIAEAEEVLEVAKGEEVAEATKFEEVETAEPEEVVEVAELDEVVEAVKSVQDAGETVKSVECEEEEFAEPEEVTEVVELTVEVKEVAQAVELVEFTEKAIESVEYMEEAVECEEITEVAELEQGMTTPSKLEEQVEAQLQNVDSVYSLADCEDKPEENMPFEIFEKIPKKSMNFQPPALRNSTMRQRAMNRESTGSVSSQSSTRRKRKSSELSEQSENDLPSFQRTTRSMSNKRNSKKSRKSTDSLSSNSSYTPRRSTSRSRRSSRGTPSSRRSSIRGKASRSHSRSSSTSSNPGRLTRAVSPMLHTKYTKQNHVPSTLEIELEEIERARERKRQRFEINLRNAEVVCSSVNIVLPGPVRSTQPLTQPEEFNFSTDRRFGRRKSCTPGSAKKNRRSTANLKSNDGLTIPQPFALSTDMRGGEKTPKKEYVPLINRCKWGGRKSLSTSEKKKKKRKSHQLTQPQPFNLSTSLREKPEKILSTEERELLEIQNAPQFKAREVNANVLQSNGDLGIPKIKKLKLTEVREFSLSKTNRPTPKVKTPQKVKPFKARAIPRNNIGVRTRAQAQKVERIKPTLTVPASPSLSYKNRPARKTIEEEFKPFKARPMPRSSKKFTPRQRRKSVTVATPFNLSTESRGAVKDANYNQKLEEKVLSEQERRQFRARAVNEGVRPSSGGKFVERHLTEPAPFQLESVRLHEQEQERVKQNRKKEMAEDAAKRKFKAKPVPSSLHGRPGFVPQQSNAPLTEIRPFNLNSDKRAEDREEFETQKEERMMQAEAQKQVQEKQKMRQEAQENRKLRRSLVHKPMPIMHQKPVMIYRARTPLTEPESPMLRTKTRAHIR